MATSPVRHRNSDHNAPQMLNDSRRSISPLFSVPRQSAIGQNTGPSPQKSYLNPSSGPFSTSRGSESTGFGGFQNYRTEEENRRPFNSAGFGSNGIPAGLSRNQVLSGDDADTMTTNFGMASINGSLPASRNGTEAMSQSSMRPPVTLPYSHFSHGSASFASQRPSHSTHPSFHSDTQGLDDRFTPSQENGITSNFSKLSLQNDDLNFNPHATLQRPAYNSHTSFDASFGRQKYQFGIDDSNYNGFGSFTPDGMPDGSYIHQPNFYRSVQLGERGSASPGASDYRRSLNSPFYSTGGTPPVGADQYRSSSGSGLSSRASNGQAALLDRKLRGLQQEQQSYLHPQTNPLQNRLQYGQPYDYTSYASMRVNPLAYYPMPTYTGLAATPMVPRGPNRDSDPGQIVRSPLLEEFRTNNKTNKRYELRVRLGIFKSRTMHSLYPGYLRSYCRVQWRPTRVTFHPTKARNSQQR